MSNTILIRGSDRLRVDRTLARVAFERQEHADPAAAQESRSRGALP